jgi:pimeloyl-ACP methyl ester carboxylesterase
MPIWPESSRRTPSEPYARPAFTEHTLPDDRTLEYADLGDPHGTPVLVWHGTPATSGQAAIFAEVARDRGVRIVAPTRPGYAASTPTPPGLTTAAADALELAEALGLDGLATMGLSGGGPFALAVAATAPDRVTGVALLAGTAPYFEVMPPSEEDAGERRVMAAFVAGDRDAAVAEMTRLADADFGGLRDLSDAGFAAAMEANRPPSETWLERHPAALELFLADFRRAIAGSAGYVRDCLSWGDAWDIDLGQVTAPVHQVYGDADTMVPMAHAEWLRARLPTADLLVVPGGHGDATFGAVAGALDTIAAG